MNPVSEGRLPENQMEIPKMEGQEDHLNLAHSHGSYPVQAENEGNATASPASGGNKTPVLSASAVSTSLLCALVLQPPCHGDGRKLHKITLGCQHFPRLDTAMFTWLSVSPRPSDQVFFAFVDHEHPFFILQISILHPPSSIHNLSNSLTSLIAVVDFVPINDRLETSN